MEILEIAGVELEGVSACVPARASGGSFATLAGSIVPAGDTVRVEVTPVSAYGTRGRPIAATVDGDSLRSGTAKFGGLSVVGI